MELQTLGVSPSIVGHGLLDLHDQGFRPLKGILFRL
jgi:hypothetical protein